MKTQEYPGAFIETITQPNKRESVFQELDYERLTREFDAADQQSNNAFSSEFTSHSNNGRRGGTPGDYSQLNVPTSLKSRLVTINASSVKPRNIDFIWAGRLARGKHTCFAGEGGLGKSQLLIDVTARITSGGIWPCSDERAPIGNVIILSAEDGIEDVLVPRLLAAGANMKRVDIVKAVRHEGKGERKFNLQQDLEELEKKIAEIGDVALVWIDPVSSYMGKVDSHNNTALRSVLDPISEVAERTNSAFASVTHFNKGSADKGIKTVNRVMGGAAFTNAPRAAFAVVEDPDDKDRRLVLHLKNNLAPKQPGLAFRLGAANVGNDEQGKEIWATHILWEAELVETTADEAVTAAAPGGAERRSVREEASDFLFQLLSDGPISSNDIWAAAAANGIAARTLRRAKADLGIKARHRPDLNGGWEWTLPEECPKTS
jgi:putative DNA primase/helicase